jgi:hypothetical protein
MNRKRITSEYNAPRHDSKRHCKDDLACQGCCSCVDKLNNQNTILKDKVAKLLKEKD